MQGRASAAEATSGAKPAGSRAAAWSPHHSNELESDISDTGTIAPSHWAPGECPSQKLKIIEPAGDRDHFKVRSAPVGTNQPLTTLVECDSPLALGKLTALEANMGQCSVH